jgi:hypothetical protein
MPGFDEEYRVWYVEEVEGDTGIGTKLVWRVSGQTPNFDRAEAVEMFFVENGYERVVIETVRYYDDGHIEDDVYNKLNGYLRDVE